MKRIKPLGNQVDRQRRIYNERTVFAVQRTVFHLYHLIHRCPMLSTINYKNLYKNSNNG